MKTVGFLISEKENELRRAIVLEDITKIINKDKIYFQKGYGEKLGFSDEDILGLGCHVVSKEEVMLCDIICDAKIGDSDDLGNIKDRTIFGWIHATQNYDITQKCIDNNLTVYAWEKMFDKYTHVFHGNNQIAGQAAIMHAQLQYGKTFTNLNVAVLGNGNTAKGAITALNSINANITVFCKEQENEFKENIHKFDVIVNCILWDVERQDHIIYKEDLKRLPKNALIIDVSCDRAGGIETSIPTTIENPTYVVDGIMHYVVDHTPSLLFKDASKSISEQVVKYIDCMIEEKNNVVLENALIIKNGIIIDEEINKFQKRG